MKFTRLVLPFVCASVLTSAVSVQAQDQSADIRPAAKSKPVEARPGINVDFPGGTISQLVGLTANQSGGPAFNLIGEKEDLAVTLPPFSLRNVTPLSLVLALRQLLEPRGLTVVTERDDVFVLRKLSTGWRKATMQRGRSFTASMARMFFVNCSPPRVATMRSRAKRSSKLTCGSRGMRDHAISSPCFSPGCESWPGRP